MITYITQAYSTQIDTRALDSIAYTRTQSNLYTTISYLSDSLYNFVYDQTSTASSQSFLCDSTQTWMNSWSDRSLIWTIQTPSERMREILRSRSAPTIHRGNRRRALSTNIDAREARARSTLRNMLSDSFFRKFLRDGFITVVSKSGLTYRIYPGSGITEVYDRGIMVETMCVVLKGNFSPTDELIMRYLLILNDEGEFSKYAVRHKCSQLPPTNKKLVFTPTEVEPLTTIWDQMQRVA